MRDRTPDVERLVAKYKGLDFVPLRIQDAFSAEWWGKVHASREEASFSVDMSSEGESPLRVRYVCSMLTVHRATTLGARIVLYLHPSSGFACLSIVPTNCDCRADNHRDPRPAPTATYCIADWIIAPRPRDLAYKSRCFPHFWHLTGPRVQPEGGDAGRMGAGQRQQVLIGAG